MKKAMMILVLVFGFCAMAQAEPAKMESDYASSYDSELSSLSGC